MEVLSQEKYLSDRNVRVTFGSSRLKPIKLRQHIKNSARKLEEVNGRSYKENRERLIRAYCKDGLDGVKFAVVSEMMIAKYDNGNKVLSVKLSPMEKFKKWIYGNLRR